MLSAKAVGPGRQKEPSVIGGAGPVSPEPAVPLWERGTETRRFLPLQFVPTCGSHDSGMSRSSTAIQSQQPCTFKCTASKMEIRWTRKDKPLMCEGVLWSQRCLRDPSTTQSLQSSPIRKFITWISLYLPLSPLPLLCPPPQQIPHIPQAYLEEWVGGLE